MQTSPRAAGQGDLCWEQGCSRAGAARLPASRADILAAGPKQSEITASNPKECWTRKAGDLGEPRGTSGYWGPRWKKGRAQAHSRGTSMETGILLLGGQLGHGVLWVPSQRLLNSSDDSAWPLFSLWANNFTASVSQYRIAWFSETAIQEKNCKSWHGKVGTNARMRKGNLLLSVIFLRSQWGSFFIPVLRWSPIHPNMSPLSHWFVPVTILPH